MMSQQLFVFLFIIPYLKKLCACLAYSSIPNNNLYKMVCMHVMGEN
jgi:hypothetical protein